MRHAPIPARLFTTNRHRLRDRLPPRSVVVVNANDIPPTNADGTAVPAPNSDLFYLAGVEQEESILLLAPDDPDEKQREVLFLRETSEHIATWEGHKLTMDEARRVTGIDNVRWLSDFPAVFRTVMGSADEVWLNDNEHSRAAAEVETRDRRFIAWCRRTYPLHTYRRLAPVLHGLRWVKQPGELRLIREAARITTDAYRRVARFLKPGVMEYEVEAEFAHEFIRQRATFAYTPIVASGRNGCVLHYLQNDQPCRKGDILLLDVAAAYANYNADVTRALPVSGRFTRRQRQVYQAVLRVLRRSVAALVPGKQHRAWQKEAEAFMQEELLRLGLLKPADLRRQSPDRPAVKRFFMHGIGHSLGLAVHDVNNAGTPFAAGTVMTVEPGIYLPDEGFAIRLEDDILITEQGPVNLTSDIPLEPDDVEAAMAKGRRR